MQLSIMAAISENQVLGKDGQLVWHLPADQRLLEDSVRGRTAIMGRISYESFRASYHETRCLVVSRQSDLLLAPGDQQAVSFPDAVQLARAAEGEVFVLGGAQVYAEALPLASKLYLTRVHHEFKGDTFFPQIDFTQWQLVAEQYHPADAEHAYSFTFLSYERGTA